MKIIRMLASKTYELILKIRSRIEFIRWMREMDRKRGRRVR